MSICQPKIYPIVNGYGEHDARKCVVFLRFLLLYLFKMMPSPYTAQVRPWANSQAKPCGSERDM